jgi:hypothetical protein
MVLFQLEDLLRVEHSLRINENILISFSLSIVLHRINWIEVTGFLDAPTCERCLQEDESATHTLCDCEAMAYLRFRHLGQFFMESSDFYDAPII